MRIPKEQPITQVEVVERAFCRDVAELAGPKLDEIKCSLYRLPSLVRPKNLLDREDFVFSSSLAVDFLQGALINLADMMSKTVCLRDSLDEWRMSFLRF